MTFTISYNRDIRLIGHFIQTLLIRQPDNTDIRFIWTLLWTCTWLSMLAVFHLVWATLDTWPQKFQAQAACNSTTKCPTTRIGENGINKLAQLKFVGPHMLNENVLTCFVRSRPLQASSLAANPATDDP